MLNTVKIKKIFAIFKKNNAAPTTELSYHSNFELLISVILSAQATDISVNKATQKLYKKANTPEKILKLGEAGLISYIKSIGLFNTKAKNILKTCQILLDKYNAEVPKDRKALESLPGVGRKTANVILNTAFGEPTIAVDTHIFRVSNRIGLVHAKTPLATEKQLLEVIPKQYQHDAHHWLILHGRYTCIARQPKCYTCPINAYCEYTHKTQLKPNKQKSAI
ncbi:MAG: endonuclease III [Pseudomonadota bacterium]